MRVATFSLLLLILTSGVLTKSIKRDSGHSMKEIVLKEREHEQHVQNRYFLLSFLGRMLSYVFGDMPTSTTSGPRHSENSNEISVMTWNILAPIWVNTKTLNESGIVDMNLLDTQIRLKLIAQRILETGTDFVALQEVQIDTYDVMRTELNAVYESMPFAPHGAEHWKDLLETSFVENGMATFFNKRKFVSLSSDLFFTSDAGNAAQISVFRRMASGVSDDAVGPPILLANCHFQHDFGIQDSLLRVTQGSALIKEVQNKTKELRSKFSTEEAVVMMAGDFNSITGAPGVENIKENGFINVREATNNTDASIYFPAEVITTFLPPFEGLPIDTVFVPTSDVNSGRIVVKSTLVPDVRKKQYSDERTYIRRVLNIVLDDLKQGKLDTDDASRFLAKLLNSLTDGNEYDTNFNRALRLGSDHLPVSVILAIKD